MKVFLCVVCISLAIVTKFPLQLSAQTLASPELGETALPSLQITELLPNPDGTDTGQEWIELYNQTESVIDIQGLQLWVNDKQVSELTEAVSIASRSYYLWNLVAAPLPNCSTKPCNVSIEIKLNNRVLDSMAYQAADSGKSWSRVENDTWTNTYPLTPGQVNIKPKLPTTLRFSEIYPSPSSDEDEWVEIYNYGSEPIDLSGWKIGDNSSSGSLGDKQLVSAGSFLVIENLSISLNNTGDNLRLISPEGDVVDQIAYSKIDKGYSWSKFDAEWKLTTSATPGSQNVFVPVPAPKPTSTSLPKVPVPPVPTVVEPAPKPVDYTLPLGIVFDPNSDQGSAQGVVAINLVGLWYGLGIAQIYFLYRIYGIKWFWQWWKKGYDL